MKSNFYLIDPKRNRCSQIPLILCEIFSILDRDIYLFLETRQYFMHGNKLSAKTLKFEIKSLSENFCNIIIISIYYRSITFANLDYKLN